MPIYKGDVGTKFILEILDQDGAIVDLSPATEKKIILKRNSIKLEKTASFVSTGTDGQIFYVTQANDLSESGNWSIQGRVTLPNGVWHTEIQTFSVETEL